MNTDRGASSCKSCEEGTSPINFFSLHFFSLLTVFHTHLQVSQIAVRGPPFAFQVSTRVEVPLGKQLLRKKKFSENTFLMPHTDFPVIYNGVDIAQPID